MKFSSVGRLCCHVTLALTLLAADVRGQAEWEAGHLPGVPNIPLGYLTRRLAEVPRDRPVVVHCQAGSRSAIAASVLRSRGIAGVINLTKGYQEWEARGLNGRRYFSEDMSITKRYFTSLLSILS